MKKTNRSSKLSLTTQTVRALQQDELAHAAGGESILCLPPQTASCVSCQCTIFPVGICATGPK
jgi:hypothetical protein